MKSSFDALNWTHCYSYIAFKWKFIQNESANGVYEYGPWTQQGPKGCVIRRLSWQAGGLLRDEGRLARRVEKFDGRRGPSCPFGHRHSSLDGTNLVEAFSAFS